MVNRKGFAPGRAGAWSRMVGLLGAVALLLLPAIAGADAAELVKEASSAFGSAERAFFTGRFETAKQSLDKARDLTEQALAEDPENVQAKSLNNRVKTLTDRLNVRLGGTPVAPAAPPAPAAPGQTEPAALPSGATTLLRDIDRKLGDVDRLIGEQGAQFSQEYRVNASRAALDEAKGLMATLRQRHEARIGQNHPEVVARQQRIDTGSVRIDAFEKGVAEAAAGQQQAAAAASGASGPWIEKLRPYILPTFRGGDADKYLISSATMDRDEMQKRLGIYASAMADMKAYRAANVSNKTEELQGIEKDLAKAIAEFEESLAQYGQENKEETTQQMEHWTKFGAEQTAKVGRGEDFYLISNSAFPDLRRRIDESAMFVKADDPEIAALERQLEELRKVDYELRRKRIADTRMGREQYTGEDKTAIVKLAGEIVIKKKPDARILRTIVLSEDWKEQAQWEYTDTTRSAMRYRVTRSVTVEVSAKVGSEVTLHTIDISKDRRTDGTWGAMYGHIMYDRPILEENVVK